MTEQEPADSPRSDDGTGVIAQIAQGVGSLPAGEWDRLAGDDNPFVSHGFLSAMEDSGSVGPGTGWQAMPIVLPGPDGTLRAAAPAYLKGHSQGEYVFDQQWAHAFERAGGNYYPKLQIAAPFSPVPGPRLLLRDSADAPALLHALELVAEQNGLSSVHATFVAPEQIALFADAGWLIREDSQFHWRNDGYASFDDFLAALSARKRKAVKRERRRAQEQVDIVHRQGAAISEEDWDFFWTCYQDTGARKWGTPYLTRSAFTLLHQRLGEKLLLILAYHRGRPVAAALNVIGKSRLFGRYWGCIADIDCLHFELCYYQAIDAAIARGLDWVEAGAQGGHKLARGYAPVPTWSAHYIVNASFRAAIADFLERERRAVEADIAYLSELTPFRKGD